MAMSTPTDIEAQTALLAFEVTLDEMRCVTFAPTVKAARCNAVLAAREAGYYRSGTWPSARVRRMPSWDNFSLKDDSRKCWSVEFVEGYP